jgi:uncharacterized membrane protein YhaH (DUF805 family)
VRNFVYIEKEMKMTNWYVDAFKKYATFHGRASREAFWTFCVFNGLISILFLFIDSLLISKQLFGVFSLIYGVIVLSPSLALGARRLHDSGRSGWWLLVALVPYIGVLINFVFMVLDSDPGTNQYGPNPKDSLPNDLTS